MDFRTDLALERSEIIKEQSGQMIKSDEFSEGNVTITRIEIEDEKTSKLLGKPIGTYITAEVPPLANDSELFDGRLDVIAKEISSLLPKDGLILVAGLGNDDITPDALGPKSVELILATRHISNELAESIGFKNLRPVAGIIPGVLGKTGIETGEIIYGIAKSIKPSAVIIIDALASRKLSRLGRTVQISNSGITPGSGVGNARQGIDKQLLGVDVISIGVPTVVDSFTLAKDLIENDEDKKNIEKILSPDGQKMIVTPREIDLMIDRASLLVGMSVNHALQPDIDCEDILSLVT